MPELIEGPATVEAAGTKPKVIHEFVGRVNTGEARVSVARMQSPEGWLEPGQRPEFDEWTLVLADVGHAHSSRCTVSGANAGRQTATYSAPSGSGEE